MRHLQFALLLALALFVAFPTGVVWAMSECSLHETAMDNCGRNADRAMYVWFIALAASFAAAVYLHLLRSKWRSLGLVAVGCAPLVAVLLVGLLAGLAARFS